MKEEMTMSDKFNLKRFGKYYVYDLSNIWKNNGMLLLIFALFPIISYMIYMFFSAIFTGKMLLVFTSGMALEGPKIVFRFVIFIIMTVLFIMIYPSRSYGQVTDKAKGSAWLMLPASTLEKFTSMMLNCLVVIPLVFLIVYAASDALVCLFDSSCGAPLVKELFRGYDDLWTGKDVIPTGNGIWLMFASILEYASVFILGALLFKKWKIVGTLLWLWIIGMLISGALGVIASAQDWKNLGMMIQNWVSKHADNIDFYINLYINIVLAVYIFGCGIWSWFKIKRIQH